MPAAEESGMAEVNGIKLYYAVYGSGEPLLMLHGGLGHSDVWGAQIPVFAEKYKVIAVDSRGHGRSTRDDMPFGYDLMADDVVALMDKLGIDKASIVGWSDGGIIGLDIAIRYPERLDKLFAFGANYNLSGLKDGIDNDPTFNAYIERAGGDYARLSPTPKDFDAFVEAIAAMWYSEPDFSKEQMMGITSPVAIADGEHDEAIRPEHTKEMAELIPGRKARHPAERQPLRVLAGPRALQQGGVGLPRPAPKRPGARRRPGPAAQAAFVAPGAATWSAVGREHERGHRRARHQLGPPRIGPPKVGIDEEKKVELVAVRCAALEDHALQPVHLVRRRSREARTSMMRSVVSIPCLGTRFTFAHPNNSNAARIFRFTANWRQG